MIKVYGCSDDLIEIEGDIKEEFSKFGTSEDEPCLLAFDNGTILKCFYDNDGIWRFKVISHGNTTVWIKQPDLSKDEESETAIIDVPVKIIAFGANMEYCKVPQKKNNNG
ncbi:MAG: hypothetical protein ACM34K_13225 [Bacillota bacterium]